MDEYNKRDQTGKTYGPIHYLIQKVDMKNGYLYSVKDNAKPLESYDIVDQVFIKTLDDQQPPISPPCLFYGLHTYGGYHGFFRPDLEEVINLIAPSLYQTYSNTQQMIQQIDRIYVTTEMYPSDHINQCYDNKADRHRARTTIWIIEKK